MISVDSLHATFVSSINVKRLGNYFIYLFSLILELILLNLK